MGFSRAKPTRQQLVRIGVPVGRRGVQVPNPTPVRYSGRMTHGTDQSVEHITEAEVRYDWIP